MYIKNPQGLQVGDTFSQSGIDYHVVKSGRGKLKVEIENPLKVCRTRKKRDVHDLDWLFALFINDD